MVMKKTSVIFSRISSKTIRILSIALPIMLCAFIWFAISYINASIANPVLANYIYKEISDHLFISLVLVFGGAAVFDCSIANGDLKK